VARFSNDEHEWQTEAFNTRDFENHKNSGEELVVREITVRSMMGSYGGYAGLFEVRRKESIKDNDEEFEYHYSSCPFVINHIPWVVLVMDIVIIVIWLVYGLSWVGRISSYNVIFNTIDKSQPPSQNTSSSYASFRKRKQGNKHR